MLNWNKISKIVIQFISCNLQDKTLCTLSIEITSFWVNSTLFYGVHQCRKKISWFHSRTPPTFKSNFHFTESGFAAPLDRALRTINNVKNIDNMFRNSLSKILFNSDQVFFFCSFTLLIFLYFSFCLHIVKLCSFVKHCFQCLCTNIVFFYCNMLYCTLYLLSGVNK